MILVIRRSVLLALISLIDWMIPAPILHENLTSNWDFYVNFLIIHLVFKISWLEIVILDIEFL